MQDVDRVAHVQTFAQPLWSGRARVQIHGGRPVPGSQNTERIVSNPGRRWHLRQQLASRTAEPQLPIRIALDLNALFVHRPVVSAAQDRKVRERRGPALRPVLDVMTLPEPHPAPREPAAAVSMLQCPA
jgi:hypothetical protein